MAESKVELSKAGIEMRDITAKAIKAVTAKRNALEAAIKPGSEGRIAANNATSAENDLVNLNRIMKRVENGFYN